MLKHDLELLQDKRLAFECQIGKIKELLDFFESKLKELMEQDE
jgi:hypothetical protein